jgi:hypothetical protein
MIDKPTEVMAIVALISPLLRGRPPEVQSAVLAELLSLWLAGHVIEEQRAIALTMHLELVADLTRLNVPALLARMPTKGTA